MLNAAAKEALRERKVEFGYAATGAGLGLAFSVTGLLVDMQVRAWSSLDPSAAATFSATAMHSLALLSPAIIGWIFLTIGRSQRLLRDKLMQLNQTEQLLRSQAHLDPVTGLYNRAYLTKRLEEGLATRIWERRGVVLYMLDLDDFKHINDTFGHRAGDLVLEEVARRLIAAAGPEDLSVRLGGDEFVVVHFPAADETLPELFAEKLLAMVTREMRVDDTRISPNTSIGIARVGLDGATWSDVMRSVDVALYQAKLEAQSSYRLFVPEMKAMKDDQLLLEAEMRAGIDRGEFELHYQPIYGTTSGAIRSFEALVRWNHPTRGLVPPLDFIPLAETSGLIVRLGRFVLIEACRTAATWPKPIGIAVNLSPVQFKDANLVDHVEQALAQSGLAPGRLDLEITESLLLEASHRVKTAMSRLRALGVRITMDDFGTGFSSLSNLRNFSFDRLKIDRSFTRDVAASTEDAEIVRTIVRLSRTLRMETILEGVETESQLSFARSEGLTEVQGFYYSKPMTGDAVDVLLAERDDDSPAIAASAA
ncbi:EAL domain-containing protein [Aureimonas sp. SA4125]|uniref:putative bifunctional diguanylate cyclase/phosphodiesterase n=1 Tax=Aureimonas sp. SA4125 TaxID=2826993 RepID=UPI001CC4946D|nr:EAL domain-containing protein [Aureimonas sp. SA4125]